MSQTSVEIDLESFLREEVMGHALEGATIKASAMSWPLRDAFKRIGASVVIDDRAPEYREK
jgi:hypothetical protein